CSCEFPSELHSVHTDRKHIRHCIWTENKNLKKGINDPSLASIYSQQLTLVFSDGSVYRHRKEVDGSYTPEDFNRDLLDYIEKAITNKLHTNKNTTRRL
ncbi:MAG: hypothetical protein ACRDCE_18085, partial [Cetobacterium sp.]|uniref:hypothetical protein n=1 Tax=Cetobacterium sp. TaxID=2071632 RepID=UPI003EE7CC31